MRTKLDIYVLIRNIKESFPRYYSFRLPHLNISTGPPSDKLDNNSQRMWLIKNFFQWNGYNHFRFALDFSYNWVSERITNKRKILRRSGEGERGRCLPWSKEEDRRGHIFFEWNKCLWIKVITKLPNSEQSYKGKGTIIVSECGLLKISFNETDTTTSGLRWIFHMHSEFSRPTMCNNARWSSPLKCKVSL
jgi:hypothetical protein